MWIFSALKRFPLKCKYAQPPVPPNFQCYVTNNVDKDNHVLLETSAYLIRATERYSLIGLGLNRTFVMSLCINHFRFLVEKSVGVTDIEKYSAISLKDM